METKKQDSIRHRSRNIGATQTCQTHLVVVGSGGSISISVASGDGVEGDSSAVDIGSGLSTSG
jgi:hypothetical protein